MGVRGGTGGGAPPGQWSPEDPDWSGGPALRGTGVGAAERGSALVGADEDQVVVSGRRGRGRGPARHGLRFPAWWPLLVVLAVQAALSLRLVWADTAFQDEATYLWAGHLEWAHWLHGAVIPPFASYFSGAPVIYPPLGAVADSVGGLAGARVLSLVFMLGATVLLWGTAGRLFGRRAAFFATALFAVLGPTLHLGSFATYDALSVFLIALAAWCVVRAGHRREGTGWMVAAGAALAVANAAAYASVLFDLVVLALALLTALPGGRLAVRRCAILVMVVVVLVTTGLLAVGSSYRAGIGQTTLARVAGNDPPLSVLADAWSWTGLVIVLAMAGVICSWAGRQRRTQTWLLSLLAAAGLLGPLEQARLQTVASLNKHVGLGAWFAAIAAGYAVDRFIAAAPADRARTLTAGACVVALAFPIALGASQSRTFATDWPNASSFIAIFRPLADHGSGHLLVEDASIARYYLPGGTQWQRWSSTRNIVLPNGASTGGPSSAAGVTGDGNAGVYAEFITHGYFSYIALNFADTTPLDHKIANQLHHDPRYHIIQVVPYGIEIPPIGQGTYVIWKYESRP
jgi:Dolichyl-phosphate-mannose-protein mannosyltransferase